jgi:hypothetical protein
LNERSHMCALAFMLLAVGTDQLVHHIWPTHARLLLSADLLSLI